MPSLGIFIVFHVNHFKNEYLDVPNFPCDYVVDPTSMVAFLESFANKIGSSTVIRPLVLRRTVLSTDQIQVLMCIIFIGKPFRNRKWNGYVKNNFYEKVQLGQVIVFKQ